ncbi:hypothetical protein EGT74_24650 [Chitinophaga lutea]|uniref:Uncharacterized protein n=1 Tax=Chitinophaga lutea TaxID=2488634 RepID=A0A3N4PBU7_9BACT|nr:hypothetical protein EGT74_24650 [Chitinophaga lutea]
MVLTEIKFKATFGHEVCDVDISEPLGAGGGFHIMVNNRYWGQVVRFNGQGYSVCWSTPDWWLSKIDKSIILELITMNKENVKHYRGGFPSFEVGSIYQDSLSPVMFMRVVPRREGVGLISCLENEAHAWPVPMWAIDPKRLKYIGCDEELQRKCSALMQIWDCIHYGRPIHAEHQSLERLCRKMIADFEIM